MHLDLVEYGCAIDIEWKSTPVIISDTKMAFEVIMKTPFWYNKAGMTSQKAATIRQLYKNNKINLDLMMDCLAKVGAKCCLEINYQNKIYNDYVNAFKDIISNRHILDSIPESSRFSIIHQYLTEAHCDISVMWELPPILSKLSC